jgi:hypothetical protein
MLDISNKTKVSLPYTAPAPGFLIYNVITTDSVMSINGQEVAYCPTGATGNGITGMFPVATGDVITGRQNIAMPIFVRTKPSDTADAGSVSYVALISY